MADSLAPAGTRRDRDIVEDPRLQILHLQHGLTGYPRMNDLWPFAYNNLVSLVCLNVAGPVDTEGGSSDVSRPYAGDAGRSWKVVVVGEGDLGLSLWVKE